MKMIIVSMSFTALSLIPFTMHAQTNKGKKINKTGSENLYIDVHQLEPGKVKYEDVAKAHAKDLAVEKKYGVNFINYWVDEIGRASCRERV